MLQNDPIVRSIFTPVLNDLNRKMILLSGPRQCGKTTLARLLLKSKKGLLYSWDKEAERKLIQRSDLDHNQDLWIFDELHKFRRWKNWLKGIFDEYHQSKQILVTGSAKLNIFQKTGDSLQGRYYLHRLHPLTVAECEGSTRSSSFKQFKEILSDPMSIKAPPEDLVQQLLKLGGFPEPFCGGSDLEAKRWRMAYGQRLIQEDVRQLHALRDIDRLEILFDRLGEVASSPITLKRIAFDLEIAFETADNWMSILENLFSCFRVPPFGLPRIQAIKKQQKIFLWDWARVEDPGARLENMVALHLLRLTHWAEDAWGENVSLRYYRDQQDHEVDFLLMHGRNPLVAVEVESFEKPADRGLKYLLSKVKIPYAFQIHLKGNREFQAESVNGTKIWHISIGRFLAGLI